MTQLLSRGDISEGHEVPGPCLHVPEDLSVGVAAVIELGQSGKYSIVEGVDLVCVAHSAAEVVGKVVGLRK